MKRSVRLWLFWLLWRRPENRKRLAIVFVVHGVAALATGYAFEWFPGALLGASHDIDSPFNFMPSRFIGWWWWPIGLALSAWLVWRDHPGWASFTGVLYGGTHLPFMLPMEPDHQLRRLAAYLVPSRAADPPATSAPARCPAGHDDPARRSAPPALKGTR